MSKGKVLIAAPVHPMLGDGLMADGYELLIREKIIQQEAYEWVRDCVGIVTSTRLLLDKALIDVAASLRWIARMGSGMELIDTGYAQKKNIRCFASPEGNCNAVAEHALGMLLSITKNIAKGNDEVRQGLWLREENRGWELEGKTIGIIGLGHTGSALARKLAGFDMRILAFDTDEDIAYPAYVQRSSLAEIQREADIVSFHVPLNGTTVHYFDREFLESMRKPFILINTSRGGVVHTEALWEGLSGNKVTGAALDVIEEEPLDRMPAGQKELVAKMGGLPHVIMTPHIGGYTREALYKMSRVLLQKIRHG